MGTSVRGKVPAILLAALSASVLTASGCGPKGSTVDPSDTTAFSNRPQSYDRFIAILKLQAPAVLATARRTDAGVVVDPKALAAVNAEQEATIEDLASLSPDISVLYRYKMVLNGLAVVAPRALEDKFRKLSSVSYVERDEGFSRLEPVAVASAAAALARDTDIAHANSTTFIGAGRVHTELGVTGKGIRVGIIDTGIDYTHAMFGGAGTEDAYKTNNPATLEPASFPTAKVTGGIDLVGTEFDSSSARFDQHIPIPDGDPLDEGGHGSHVAGTVAGKGDGVETYDGVAPEAELYAIKVFGKEGSTGDAVIVASLEFAADPDANGDPNDHLDVVNLSLGSGFGMPHILYSEAAANLTRGETVMVAAAGNAGVTPYIVGAPSTADDAFSVAASIDGMEHNWKFRAVSFATPATPEILAEAVEAGFSQPIAAGNVTGKLAYIGLAAQDLTDEQKAAVRGNVALIDRGAAAFVDKARRASEAGAVGVVVANNVDGEAFAMGGDGHFELPAIMITKDLGTALKAAMGAGDVTITFNTPKVIEHPELVDTLTDFSSRGPRSVDGALKPEISAPGANIISAAMGSGNKGVQFSGTSMATPHMAGVMALLKEARGAKLSAPELKALAMGTATSIDDKDGVVYPVAHMGAGRVQAFEAATLDVLASPPALSLGEVVVESAKVLNRELTLRNLSDKPKDLTLKAKTKAGLVVTLPRTVRLAAGESKKIALSVKLMPPAASDLSVALDGAIEIGGASTALHVPVLAVINRTSRLEVKSLVLQATSEADAAGAAGELTIKNGGKNSGEALPFNLLGADERKGTGRRNLTRNPVCDLESAGWRVVTQTIEGAEVEVFQVALKVYNPVTSWHLCEPSIQIDRDGDGVAEQELLGTYAQTLTGNAAHVGLFASILTDAEKMRDIRHQYEADFPNSPDPVYTDAILDTLDLLAYGHSTVIVVSAPLASLAKGPEGDLRVKIAMQTDSSTPEADDFLGKEEWLSLTPSADGQAYLGLPASVVLKAGETAKVPVTKGKAKGKLVVYFPLNGTTDALVGSDQQAAIAKPKYAFH